MIETEWRNIGNKANIKVVKNKVALHLRQLRLILSMVKVFHVMVKFLFTVEGDIVENQVPGMLIMVRKSTGKGKCEKLPYRTSSYL